MINLRRVTFATLVTLAACQITLVTAYDETFDQEITATQKDVDSLMSKIAGDTAQPYAAFSADYARIHTDIDAMAVRAGSHTNNAATVDSVARLAHSFNEFQGEHAAAQTPLSPAHVRGELGIINHEFQLLMGQELAKKSGQ